MQHENDIFCLNWHNLYTRPYIKTQWKHLKKYLKKKIGFEDRISKEKNLSGIMVWQLINAENI